jgi:hypothetical protein
MSANIRRWPRYVSVNMRCPVCGLIVRPAFDDDAVDYEKDDGSTQWVHGPCWLESLNDGDES